MATINSAKKTKNAVTPKRSGTINFKALPVLESALMAFCSTRTSKIPYTRVPAAINMNGEKIIVPVLKIASVLF
jgi:hypothetical protein